MLEKVDVPYPFHPGFVLSLILILEGDSFRSDDAKSRNPYLFPTFPQSIIFLLTKWSHVLPSKYEVQNRFRTAAGLVTGSSFVGSQLSHVQNGQNREEDQIFKKISSFFAQIRWTKSFDHQTVSTKYYFML